MNFGTLGAGFGGLGRGGGGYASVALLLMGAETQGLTFAATDQSMSILDTTTSANNYTGELSAKLGSIRTSAGMTYLSSGLLGWGPENLLFRSQEFDNAYWTKGNVTVSADAVVAPDGITTADKLIEDNATAQHICYRSITPTSVEIAHTWSIYAKAAERSWLRMRLDGGAGTGTYFNLSAGTVGTTEAGYTAAISSVGNGWYRCSIKMNTPATFSFAIVGVTTADGTASYLGDNASGIYVCGAQLERAASASTYKPTTSAAYYGLRLDYDTRLTGGPGYLVEEARTNVVLWNRDLTNAVWTKTNVTAAKDQDGVDGVANAASKITASAGNGTCLQAITLGSSARFQWCFIKRVTGSGVIEMTMDNGATWTAVTVTSSWAAVEIPTQTLANPTVGFRIVTNGDAIAVDMVSNENGTFRTSAIPTTTATVTRAADLPLLAMSALPSSTTEITMYEKFNVPRTTPHYGVMGIGSFGGADTINVLQSGSSDLFAYVTPDSFPDTSIYNASGHISGNNKVCLVSECTAPNNAYYVNGSSKGSDTTPGPYGTMNYSGKNLAFGLRDSSGGLTLNGWLLEGCVFPTRKSNAYAAAITA